MTPRPPRSTLFPYTTLFRSLAQGRERRHRGDEAADAAAARRPRAAVLHLHVRPGGGGGALPHHGRKGAGDHPGAARVDVGTRRAALRDRRPGRRGEDPPAPRIRRVDHRRRGRAAELRGPALRVPAAAARHGTAGADGIRAGARGLIPDRKSTRLNSSHTVISYAVFCLKKKKKKKKDIEQNHK